MNKLIAVYGTLRKGQSNHHVLGDSLFIKTIRLKGFLMYGANSFPAIIRGTEKDKITVEIYRINNSQILKELDLLEGFDRSNPKNQNSLYTIQEIRIEEVEESIEIYTFDHHPEMVHQIGPLLKSGDWLKR